MAEEPKDPRTEQETRVGDNANGAPAENGSDELEASLAGVPVSSGEAMRGVETAVRDPSQAEGADDVETRGAPETRSGAETRQIHGEDARDHHDGMVRRIEEGLAREEPIIQSDPLIGRTFANRFVIESKVGSGGMGSVYRARQLGMDRHVAIKVLRSDYTNNAMLIKRFHMEALAVSRLNHPSTIRIYDFGQTEDGILFIAMEFLDGVSLEHVLRSEGALAVRRALRIIAQACRSLSEAHAKEIIHRDLKPDNIFLCRVDQDADFVKILDFGVAKLRLPQDNEGTLTQAGMVFGTPKYMSPEQSRSDAIDLRADIYALGIMLYEMLTGRAPFSADNPLTILIMQVQQQAPAFQTARPDLVIPPPVEGIVRRAIAKRPADRFQNATEMLEAVEEMLSVLPESFEKVMTREDAEALGIDVSRDEAFTRPDGDFGEGRPSDETEMLARVGPDELLGGIQRRRRRRVAVFSAVGAVLALGITALVLYLNLPGEPAGFRRLLADSRLELGTPPPLKADTVALVIRSKPSGATVYVEDQPIGKAPLRIERLREDRAEDYVFRLEEHAPSTVKVSYGDDGEFLAQLDKVEPKVIVKEVTRTVPAPASSRRPTKPAGPTEPVRFQSGKVGDLKGP